MEWKKGDTFAFIAFCSYGFFWLSLIFINILVTLKLAAKPDGNAMGCYCLIWGVFTFGMWMATFKIGNKALCFVFFTVVLLFALLAAHFYADSKTMGKIAGVEGIVCGLSAIYVAMGELLNPVYGRKVVPLFPHNKK